MNTDGGGWTVFQQRFNGELDFNRKWKDYKEGFGVALHNKEYWLGNEYLHILTMKGNCTLRADVVTRGGDPGYAVYQNFSVGPESEAYKLRIGKYSGTENHKPKAYKIRKETETKANKQKHQPHEKKRTPDKGVRPGAQEESASPACMQHPSLQFSVKY
ncbi:hypothetical protein FSP39_016150 [Pinctada imbricata]|uniref:Fibrinogen C-terminal domain-containing protein n=1 Tax=Pinctada imbricata TaxID=66713 RepID=A0AA88XUY8_PINIB|nr:hypothetical protein FSP39_016150 [Pinctada imbricata]